jgi:PKD repeat protein
MSQVKYSYAYFDVVNFTNEFSTSGYALSISPFTFKPQYDESLFSNKRVLWDFGDGTTSKSITATHVYDLPGEYTVSLYLYDGQGESYYDIFTQKVFVYNFLQDSIVLSAADLNFETSSINNKFIIYRFNSWQTYNALSASGYAIELAVSGNNAPFIVQQEYNADKYAHLKKYSQFYQYAYNEDIQAFDYAARDVIKTTNEALYVKIANNRIVFCNALDQNATFVGTSGVATASYKDDEPTTTHPTLILAHFTDVTFPDYSNAAATALPVLQTNAQSFYCTLTSMPPASLSITSTGLSAMQINAMQFANTRIPFVVQIIDANDAACKYCSNLKRVDSNGSLSASTVQINVVDATTNASLTATFNDEFGFFANYDTGIYKGYCSFDAPLSSVKIIATAQVNTSFGFQTLSGESAAFAVMDNDYYLAKINENFDQAATYKSYRFQETLLDKTAFFDGFLGTIVGDADATPNVLGKRIHEKMSNFVSNTQDINACNIPALYSLKQMLNVNIKQFDSYNFSVPANLARIMDALSIKQSKLWGHANEFADNFDKKGFDYSTTWGINLGDKLDALTTILTAGSASQSIVAYEKFSNTYRLINTDALSSSNLQFIDANKQTYALSAYNNYWGWGLILPADFAAADFDKYYLFYKYNNVAQGTILDNIINWDDANTTINRASSSYNDWSKDNGTMQLLLANALFAGLNLFSTISGASAQLIPTTLYELFLDDSSTVLTLDDNASILQLA